MGWIREGLWEEHEGSAAFVAVDGRLTGTSNARGVLFPRAVEVSVAAGIPSTEDLYELVDWADVVAWQSRCACGWTGQRWERAATIAGEYGGKDPDDAFLPDGSTVEDQAAADWAGHVAPFERVGSVREAGEALERARQNLDQAVRDARSTTPPATWEEIGRAVGMSRQSAHERWGRTG